MTTEEKLEKLRAIAQNKKVLILAHNNPDPDAISAGWALGYLLRRKFKANCQLAYGGLIARAENRAMVRLLNIDIKPLDSLNIRYFEVFALVDTQPRAGNNSLPPRIKPSIVIDHHGARKFSQGVEFADIRLHYGSSATIVTEYLLQAGLPIPKTMANAAKPWPACHRGRLQLGHCSLPQSPAENSLPD
jgi:nanoRNase/pAp phosphatase (c-di-AMP/oligoRNAs hydrolase)